MSQKRFSAYVASFNTGALLLRDVVKIAAKSGAKRDRPIPAGSIDPAAAILNGAEPTASITSRDIGTAFAAISPSAGLACPTGALLQFQSRTDGAAFDAATGGTHVTLSSGKGFLYPKSLSVDQDKEGGAELDLEYCAQYDGTTVGTPAQPNPAWAWASGQTLASAPLFGARWYLGAVYLHTAQIMGILGFKIDFGIEYKTVKADGYLYAAVGSIVSRKPEISFRCLDASYAATIASMFMANPGNDLDLYLACGAPGGARIAFATASHAKFSVASSGWAADEIEANEADDAIVTVPILPTAAIAVSVASTIP